MWTFKEAAMAEINAILLDADGVIQRAQADIQARLTRALGGTPDDVEACMLDFFAAEVLALTGATDFAVALLPVVEKWSSTCDIAALLAEWHTIEVDHSILALIEELRRSGVYCALASNQEGYRARHMSEALGYSLTFDREFYSCHLGHAKPSITYFTEIVRLADLDPGRTLFVDDRVENVEAARQAGLRAAHFVLDEVGAGAKPMRLLLASFGLAGEA
jgi:putative hydrolase of the HAD superfamily